MLSRASASFSRLLVRKSLRSQAVRCMSAPPTMTEKEVILKTCTHMDNLPSPEGSWQEGYAKQQRNYNMQLIGWGILTAVTHYWLMTYEATRQVYSLPDYKSITIDWDKPDLPPVEIEED